MGGLVAPQQVQLTSCDLAVGYGLFAVLGNILSRRHVVVEPVKDFEAPRGENAVGEEEVEDDVVGG